MSEIQEEEKAFCTTSNVLAENVSENVSDDRARVMKFVADAR
jgi:hypothetical protein